MEFEYYYVKSVNATLDIDDIGNCAIAAYNDLGLVSYLLIKTTLGNTIIFEYGPLVHDSDVLPKVVDCSFRRIEFNDIAIKKTIRTFLNNPKSQITQAREIPFEEVFENCIDIIDYVKTKEF